MATKRKPTVRSRDTARHMLARRRAAAQARELANEQDLTSFVDHDAAAQQAEQRRDSAIHNTAAARTRATETALEICWKSSAKINDSDGSDADASGVHGSRQLRLTALADALDKADAQHKTAVLAAVETFENEVAQARLAQGQALSRIRQRDVPINEIAQIVGRSPAQVSKLIKLAQGADDSDSKAASAPATGTRADTLGDGQRDGADAAAAAKTHTSLDATGSVCLGSGAPSEIE
ncbi:hypothetical protein [Nocardia asiatica]|uniref:hypothetical protein n=1 Tax=Nocardia asiatica TaxID=209252 RepID=UPI002456B701|nr:hypothetical protein [Nocardia asiatica]